LTSELEPVLQRWLDAHAEEPIVKRAYLLAAGLGDEQDKRDHIQDLIRMVKGIATPLPYDKARREDVERSTLGKREEAIDESVEV
jgi:hypothetical protein